jgi:hypothetical protein
MKKIILAAVILTSSLQLLAAGPLPVDEKILNEFNKTFQRAQEVSWSELPGGYEVKFKQDEVIVKITYDKDGAILKTLRYYSEEQLPIIVLAKVKDRFKEQKVFGVVEESSLEGTYYHITLEDEKNWTMVKADGTGSMSVEKRFKKA